MNKEYIENFRLIGFEVKECKSMKEFINEIRDRTTWTNYYGTSFKKYMNDELNGYYDCISDGWSDEDACIFIEYKDGTKYAFLPALGVEGKFKETGIKWAILSDGYGYTVYNDDLSVEWENIELDEIEREAIEKRIPIETLKLQKKILSELEQAQEIPQKEGKEETEEVPDTKEQKQAESEQAQAIPQKKGKEETEEVPDTKEPKKEQTKQQSEQNAPERKIVYKIDILEALKEAGYNQGRIKREKLLNGSAVDKIRAGSTDISLKTVSTICNLLNVEPGDILTMVTIPQKRGKD